LQNLVATFEPGRELYVSAFDIRTSREVSSIGIWPPKRQAVESQIVSFSRE
jgi:hypothetical protein